MRLYTNTIPFDVGYGQTPSDKLIPAGSTFGLVAVTACNYSLKLPKGFESDHVFVMPEIFKAAFKEVDLDK